MTDRQDAPATRHDRLAERLHKATLMLLRRLRRGDRETGLTAPQLSALSVLVYGGPARLGALADAEQVRPPTMSRLVKALERADMVVRRADPDDRRVQRFYATEDGRRALAEGRGRRIAALSAMLNACTPEDRRVLSAAADILDRLVQKGRS